MKDTVCKHCNEVVYKPGPCGCPADPRGAPVCLDFHLLGDDELRNLGRVVSIALNECMAPRDIPNVIASLNAEKEVRASGLPPANCYLCDVDDANETPYDPDRHQVCLACAAKLQSFLGEEDTRR
jgi:hypothetical protein